MARRLGAPVCGINRPDLHAALVAGADEQQIRTASEFESFEQAGGSVSVALAGGGAESGDVLIGADGLESAVRRQLLGAQAPRHSGLTMWRANVPYDDSIAPPVDFILWWGPGAKFVIFRSGPQRISWEAIVTSPPGQRDEPGRTIGTIHDRFERFVEPVHRMIDATDEQAIYRTDVVDRLPDEHWGRGRVTLLGDAAHPMTFAVGQGAAQALEDALAIARALRGSPDDLEAALRAYEAPRIERAAHFQKMAWRLARAGALEGRAAQGIRNSALALSSPIGWRMQVKDMALPT
jgi:2-polyprenyl-6-methoxyphenol hydroxylase-like FAD-dependent oxidoreductase